MNLTIRRTVALAGALVMSLGVAACSSNDKPAAGPTSSAASSTTTTTAAPTTDGAPKASDLLSEVKAKALAAKSAAFDGQIQQGGNTMKIAFKGTADGKTSDIHLEQSGLGNVHLIAVDGQVFLQGDEKFWKAQGAPASVQKAGDKFVKAPASAGSLTDSVSLKSFMDQAFGQLGNSDLDGKVGSDTVDGVDCWVLTDKSGKENGALYVAKDTKQLMRFTGTKESPGQLTFTQWNEDLGIKAPAADQVMEIQ